MLRRTNEDTPIHELPVISRRLSPQVVRSIAAPFLSDELSQRDYVVVWWGYLELEQELRRRH